MRLVDSGATGTAKIDCQFPTTFVHLGKFCGGAMGDTEIILWHQHIQCVCSTADLSA